MWDRFFVPEAAPALVHPVSHEFGAPIPSYMPLSTRGGRSFLSALAGPPPSKVAPSEGDSEDRLLAAVRDYLRSATPWELATPWLASSSSPDASVQHSYPLSALL